MKLDKPLLTPYTKRIKSRYNKTIKIKKKTKKEKKKKKKKKKKK